MDLQETSENLGKEAHQLIFDICEVAKYRLPGSEGEKKAQEFIMKKMEEFGADEVEQRKCFTYAKFFKYWPKLSLLFFLISLIVFHFSPFITILLTVLMLVNIALKLFSYTFLDVLFKKQKTRNIIGKVKAKSSENTTFARRIIIIGGHIDSTYEFPLGRKYGKKMIYFYVFVFIAAAYWLLISFYQVIIDLLNGKSLITLTPTLNSAWYYILTLILTPFIIWIAWNVVSTRPVQGANDNLSGVSVTMKVLDYIAEHSLENIELWSVVFGAEEGGMAGSKALSKELKKKIDRGDFPAESLWVVNFDSVGSDDSLIISKKEPMYRAAHDPKVYNQLAEAADKAGIDYKLKSIDAGTDSAPFSRLGIPSVGAIAAGDDGIPQNWHSREDIPENCDTIGLINAIYCSLQFLKDVDQSLSNN
ncbi:MAG: M28 family metallopeptidase [Promethearchaeia archaeon]